MGGGGGGGGGGRQRGGFDNNCLCSVGSFDHFSALCNKILLKFSDLFDHPQMTL